MVSNVENGQEQNGPSVAADTFPVRIVECVTAKRQGSRKAKKNHCGYPRMIDCLRVSGLIILQASISS